MQNNDAAPIALQIARDTENKHNANVGKLAIELSKNQCLMAELEWSKERCEKEDGTTHYDSFKKQKDIDKLATVASILKKKKFHPPSIQRRQCNYFF